MIESLGSVVCWPCVASAILSLAAGVGAVWALRKPGARDVALKLIIEQFRAKLGTCRKCMVLCVLLLIASIWPLTAAMRPPIDLRIVAGMSLVTGSLLSLTVAHFVVLFWRRSLARAGRLAGSPLVEIPRGRCCGR